MVTACVSKLNDKASDDELCPRAIIELIESGVIVGDFEGHGPDVGSPEWYSVVERRLGIEDSASMHKKGTKGWCSYVISKI